MEQNIKILAVDDDNVNLQLLSAFLYEEKFQLTTVLSGEKALEILEKDNSFDVILLDWMMPDMDGLELLHILKTRPKLKRIPVIMQTAKSNTEDYVKGINSGAYYYLTKPFEEHMLLSILNAAVVEYRHYLDLREKIKGDESICGLMEEGIFHFRTLEEGEILARWLAQACPVAESTIMGIVELLVNAVEHGNLSIGYNEKSLLLEQGIWMEEIERRQQLSENKNKRVEVKFLKTSTRISLSIKDEGEGFEYEKFFKLDETRLADNHGRGIMMARMLYFDEINYLGNGNEVQAIINLSSE